MRENFLRFAENRFPPAHPQLLQGARSEHGAHGVEQLVGAEWLVQRRIHADEPGRGKVIVLHSAAAAGRHGNDPGLGEFSLEARYRFESFKDRHEDIGNKQIRGQFKSASFRSNSPIPLSIVKKSIPIISVFVIDSHR